MVDDNILALVPNSGQEFSMVKLNDFVDELFGAVGGWIELYGDHA